MNTKQLKAKVLDLAIHGKLLSPETVAELKKSPDYETADVLLEKNRKEKEEKIAKGELKRDKKDSYIFVGDDKRHYEKFADGTVKDIEDEIPFDVPDGWAWARLGELGEWKSGSTPNRKNLDYYENGTIPWLLTGDLNNGYITQIPSKITNKAFMETSLRLNPKDSVCIAMYGATIGKLGILTFPATSNQACCVCSDFKGIQNKYLFFFLMQHKDEFIRQGFGGAQPNISKEKIIATLIPLPPMEEQIQIVKAIDNFFEKIDSLNINTLDLQNCIKQTKSKILDLAIHGKLVPQDTNDEPASVLLEKLRAEKEEKISKGEFKRDKNDSYIYKGSDNCYYEKFADGRTEEIDIPFEIPTTWNWCKLGSICDYGKCISVNANTLKSEDWILDLEDIEKDTGKIIAFKSFAERKSESTKHKFCKGQVLYSKLRPYLNKVVIAPKDGYCTSEILPLNFNNLLTSRYAQVLLMSSYFLGLVNMVTYGVKMPRLGTEDAKKMLIPVPPMQEQHRIIDKIDTLFARLENIHLELS